MHSYLITSQNQNLIQNEINNLVNKNKLKPYLFEIKSISDVKELNIFLKHTIEKSSGIIIKEIDKASEEALNAFLKNLEEPQKYIVFVLSASSIYTVLPTIVSRCQIINLNISPEISSTSLLKEFLSKESSDKLSYVSNIKDRQDALLFIKELLYQAHAMIHLNKLPPDVAKGSYSFYKKISSFIKLTQRTNDALNFNGNVNLHLTNFVLSLE
jgi:DNA polymerase III delta prime subunit